MARAPVSKTACFSCRIKVHSEKFADYAAITINSLALISEPWRLTARHCGARTRFASDALRVADRADARQGDDQV
jgi:hypothetical protein